MPDTIDLATVQIHNSWDPLDWPVTALITSLEFRSTGVHVEHTKQEGPESWPDFTPPGWDGPLQYTLWIFVNIGGKWHGSGCIQFWRGCPQNGGPPEQFGQNWYYALDRWGEMTKYQPAHGELVGFMVTAGDARNSGMQSVHERSNVALIPFPATGDIYHPFIRVDNPVDNPQPQPENQPGGMVPVELIAQRLDIVAARLTDISVKLDTLADKCERLITRKAPAYHGQTPPVPALGLRTGLTFTLLPDAVQ